MKDWKGNTNSVFKIIGASNHADHEREKRDYYATEPKAAEMLLEIEHFAPHILEPVPLPMRGLYGRKATRAVQR